MIFPESPRVMFKKSPLADVTSKFCFPPILKIQLQPPAEFQDLVRDDFPLYTVEGPGRPVSTIDAAGRQTFTINLGGTTPTHVFTSADGGWYYRLTMNELSVGCRRYSRWEEFRPRLEKGMEALSRAYRPGLFNHVCVRYRNAIAKSFIGLSDTPWSDLLIPTIIAPLVDPVMSGLVEQYENKLTLNLPGHSGQIGVTAGLGTSTGTPEKAMIIDCHVYTNAQTGADNALAKLDAFHHVAGNFFRWCLTPRLFTALGPVAVG